MVTFIAQIPSGTPRFSGENHPEIAGTAAVETRPKPTPSTTLLNMKTVKSVAMVPMKPPITANSNEREGGGLWVCGRCEAAE